MGSLKEMLVGGSNQPCIKMASLLMKSANDAHITHLMQPDKTLALHNAMATYYDNIVGLMDTLVETSMGIYPASDIVVEKSCKIDNPITYFKNLYSSIDNLRNSVKETFLQSQIDTILQEISHTIYRLTYIIN